MKSLCRCLCLVCVSLAPLLAADPPAVPEPKPVPLWPDGAPGYDTAPTRREIPRITPYIVPSAKPHGAVLVLPGGGYGGRAPHEGAPIAQWLNTLGISAAVVDYRVQPYRHPYPLLDAQRALRWMRANGKAWNIDPTKVGILGFSAGGHLASTTLTHWDRGKPDATDPIDRESCRPDAVVLCYPVISFLQFTHGGSMRNLLGPTPSDELRRELSAETQITAETPPVYLWHTADDGGVPVENSLLLAMALRAKRIPFELYVPPKGAHGLGLAPNNPVVARWTLLCGDWLKGLGFAG